MAMNFKLDVSKIATGLAEGGLQALGTGLLGMAGGFLTKMAIAAIKNRKTAPAIEADTPDLSDAIQVEASPAIEPATTDAVEIEMPAMTDTVEVTFDTSES